MKSWKLAAIWTFGFLFVGACCLAVPNLVIRYSIHRIVDAPTACYEICRLIEYDDEAVLLAMGERSIPLLREAVDDPKVRRSRKFWLTEILIKLGDDSRFHVFTDALADTDRHSSFSALLYLRSLPETAVSHHAEILAMDPLPEETVASSLLNWLSQAAHLSPDELGAFYQVTQGTHGARALTEQERREALAIIANSRRSHDWGPL